MQDVVRLKTSLTEEMEALLNTQIRLEAHASATYLAMGAWCDTHGFDGSAEHFYAQSNGERNHMIKIFKYVADVGGNPISAEVSNIRHEFGSLREVFEFALEQEITVTQSINTIVGKAKEYKDYTTEQFLHWFLNEQVEEEFVARRCVELFDIIGDHGHELFLVDNQVGKVKYEK